MIKIFQGRKKSATNEATRHFGNVVSWIVVLIIAAIGIVLFHWDSATPQIRPVQNSSKAAQSTSNLPDSIEDNDAVVGVNSKYYSFHPNSIGMYPRISVPSLSVVKIKLQVRPGQAIQEEALDGGYLDNNTNFQEQLADDQGRLGFQFKVKRPAGSYRLAIAENGKRSVFDFWVDPNLQPQNGIDTK